MNRNSLVAILVLLGGTSVWAAEPHAAALRWHMPECGHRIHLPYTRTTGKADAPAEAVFFLDFAAAGRLLGGTPDASSMKLVAATPGAPIPFSLDYRYGDRERSPDEYVRPVTGYNGEKFPVAEGRLRRLGYLSFRPLPRDTQYHLYFNITADKDALRERSESAVRPWWVEALADPDFRMDMDADGKPDLYAWTSRGKESSASAWGIAPKPQSEGRTCLRLSSPTENNLLARPGLCNFLKSAGRRVILYQQLYAEGGITGRMMSVSLPNAYRPQGSAALYYFGEIPPKQWYEMAVEGRVQTGVDLAGRGLHNTYNGPCHVGEIHVQFPPEPPTHNFLGLETDVAESGDAILLYWQSRAGDYLYPLRLTLESKDGRRQILDAQRVEEWTEGFLLEAVVSDADGRPLARLSDTAQAGDSWKGALRLTGVKPGRYHLRFDVKSRREIPEIVSCLETDLRVLKGPFEN